MNSVPTNGVSAPAATSSPSDVRSARLGWARKWSSSLTYPAWRRRMNRNSFSGDRGRTASDRTGITVSATTRDTSSAMSIVLASGANIFPSTPWSE